MERSMKNDIEIQAIGKVLDAIKDLDEKQYRRVIAYAETWKMDQMKVQTESAVTPETYAR
jgi:hypothetical protein